MCEACDQNSGGVVPKYLPRLPTVGHILHPLKMHIGYPCHTHMIFLKMEAFKNIIISKDGKQVFEAVLGSATISGHFLHTQRRVGGRGVRRLFFF